MKQCSRKTITNSGHYSRSRFLNRCRFFFFFSDSKCHNPAIATCNTSIYPILDYQMSAWFYHEMFKSCRPLYSEYGVHHRCEANRDLPATREECERLCGKWRGYLLGHPDGRNMVVSRSRSISGSAVSVRFYRERFYAKRNEIKVNF